MKFKVFNTPREPEVFFKLEECYETVKLVACDSKGNILPDSDILSIQTDGSLRTFGSLDDNLGLKLDCGGRIIINND